MIKAADLRWRDGSGALAAALSVVVSGGEIASADVLPDPSAALRVLGTLVRPVAGTLTIDGVDALARPLEARRRIAFASPDVPLPEGLTVTEYLTFIGDARRQPRDRSGAAAARFGIGGGRLLRALGAADRQRVRLAAAAATGARVVVLDRPCHALDEAGVARLAEWLSEMRGAGAGIVLGGAAPVALPMRPLLEGKEAVA